MADWKTWLWHASLAALVTFAFGYLLDPWYAAGLATWGYLWRELDQQTRKLMNQHTIHWLDATLDVVSPAVASALVAWLL